MRSGTTRQRQHQRHETGPGATPRPSRAFTVAPILAGLGHTAPSSLYSCSEGESEDFSPLFGVRASARIVSTSCPNRSQQVFHFVASGQPPDGRWPAAGRHRRWALTGRGDFWSTRIARSALLAMSARSRPKDTSVCRWLPHSNRALVTWSSPPFALWRRR